MSAFELGMPPSTPYRWELAHNAYPVFDPDDGQWSVHCEDCARDVGPFLYCQEAVMDAASHIRAQWPRGARRP